MFQCLFCPSNGSTSLVEPSKAPILEIVCDDELNDYASLLKNADTDELPDIQKSNSTSTEETICSASTTTESHTDVQEEDQDSLDVATRTSTPSNHMLEIFVSTSSRPMESVMSWISPKSAASSEEEEENAAPVVDLGNSPVLSSPSLEESDDDEQPPPAVVAETSAGSSSLNSSGITINDDDDQEEDSIRHIRIQQELDDILKFIAASSSNNVVMEDEAIEALGIAADQVVTHNISVGQAIVNGNVLMEIAEDHYFGDSNSFVTRYAALLRHTVRQMKTNPIQNEKYYNGSEYEYIRPVEKDMTTYPSRTQNLVTTIAQTVAWGSWMSAGWVYNKMMASSSSSGV